MAGFSRSLVLIFFSLLLLFSFSEAREILVGGSSNSWAVPSSQSQTLNQWAESSRFRVGDTLVWNYEVGKDSVLEVSKEDYTNCNLSSPIMEYKDGNTKVKLERPGPFYFISGAKGRCQKGQKLIVVVLTPRNRHFFGISPAPSPAAMESPAVAPTSGAVSLQSGLMAAVGVLGLGLVLM